MPPTEEEENHNATGDDEDLEDDEDESDDGEEDIESDDEIDEDEDDQPLTQEQPPHPPPSTTISTPPLPRPPPDSPPDHKRQRTTPTTPTPTPPHPPENKKPIPIDDSRKLFQRLWTDEDEIGLLQGFLEYTSQRGGFKSASYHHDTAPFYDQIKSRLHLDFNKSQLVEKLRRLKKKYRNAMARVSSGKDLSFKTPHDQATFHISTKIWSHITAPDDEYHATPDTATTTQLNSTKEIPLPASTSSRKPPRVGADENVPDPSIIEERVKSCLAPLFKELMHSAINGNAANLTSLGGSGLIPLTMSFPGEREIMDDKWRKQRILELEVYSKRVELVQEQIKLALAELRSNGLRQTLLGAWFSPGVWLYG